MTEKTWDTEDPQDLPYRFVFSPVTDEVYLISFGFHGLGVSMIFPNHFAYHRFLVEAMKFDDAIADKVLQQAAKILGGKQEDVKNSDCGG